MSFCKMKMSSLKFQMKKWKAVMLSKKLLEIAFLGAVRLNPNQFGQVFQMDMICFLNKAKTVGFVGFETIHKFH